ncbi:uncharacterized protein LOC18033172 isoform X2 [Citrus clementina]|uniref:uncharacterized protein LOC18033172 isoform X2 n=1 Tax=Citrus clementina TaxID=85681 RepID=UPI000CED2181|nr:uncharacterized protein LOC18033172 isoform X2 [Citrus x clementina]
MRSESETAEDQRSQYLSKSDDDTSSSMFRKKSKILYTRNELISLSELDSCQKLPIGLDQSILGELSISWTGLSHSCHNSDPGTFHGYLPRHLHPNQECDLSRSGDIASNCVSEATDSVVKGSEYHLPKRSDGAYRPPHLCKAKIQSRAENEDFYNNETFGSSENLSQESAEEERRRRDSFELMRKEQLKAFQEKQNKILDEHKENLDPEIGLLLEANGNCKRFMNKYNESEESVASQAEAGDPAGHALASTFLLPAVLESRSLTKSLTSTFTSEPCDTKRDQIKGYGLHSSGLDDQFLGEKEPAGGISSGYLKEGFEVHGPQNEEVARQNSANLPSGRNEPVQTLMASTTSSAIDEIFEQLHYRNKRNVTPLVLPHEYFELSTLPDPIELYSTNHHSVKGWSTKTRKGKYPTSAADHASSQYLSLEKKGLCQTDAETSSKLNRETLDKLCFSEIEGFPKDSQTTEFSSIQRDSLGMLTRNDVLKPHRLSNESGSMKINCEGIMSSSWTKQTVASKIEENLSISDDNQTKIGFNLGSEPACMHPNSADELFLPDEDSLITADDYILPLESTSMSAGRLFKDNLLTSSSQVDVNDKLADLNPFLGEKRSTQLGLEGPVFDSYDKMGLESFYAALHTQHCFPQFGHCQMNPGRANFKSSDAQQVQIPASNSKTNIYTPQPLCFQSNVLADPFRHPHADLRRFGHPTNSPLPQQMPGPNNFAHHLVHGFPRGLPSSHPNGGMTSNGQELYPPQHLPYHYQRQNYGPFRVPNSGHTAGVIGYPAAVGKPFQMEERSRQTHPLPDVGRGSGNFGKQVDTGFWY